MAIAAVTPNVTFSITRSRCRRRGPMSHVQTWISLPPSCCSICRKRLRYPLYTTPPGRLGNGQTTVTSCPFAQQADQLFPHHPRRLPFRGVNRDGNDDFHVRCRSESLAGLCCPFIHGGYLRKWPSIRRATWAMNAQIRTAIRPVFISVFGPLYCHCPECRRRRQT